MAKVTGGTIHYYPGFTGGNAEDVAKLSSDMTAFFSTSFCLEAVLRVRASRGKTDS